MTTIPKEQIIPVNSTSYVDMLGVLIGMERLQGESSAQFAERIDLAISATRGPDFIGIMNRLCLAFGLEMSQAIRITSDVEFLDKTGPSHH